MHDAFACTILLQSWISALRSPDRNNDAQHVAQAAVPNEKLSIEQLQEWLFRQRRPVLTSKDDLVYGALLAHICMIEACAISSYRGSWG